MFLHLSFGGLIFLGGILRMGLLGCRIGMQLALAHTVLQFPKVA